MRRLHPTPRRRSELVTSVIEARVADYGTVGAGSGVATGRNVVQGCRGNIVSPLTSGDTMLTRIPTGTTVVVR